jgi:glucosamine--fructose-6-phosphate aminotransferase (isomerizing)
MRGTVTLREIQDQPGAWAAAIEAFGSKAERVERLFEARSPDTVVFTGCGSSYYLSLTAAAVFQEVTGLAAKAVPASEILQFADAVFAPASIPLLVAASRSGTTSETLRAVRVAARRGIPTLSLTCSKRSPLAREADLTLVSPKGGERSVVMTKSFSSLLLLALLVAATCGGEKHFRRELQRLPALGRRVLKIALPLMQDIGAGAARFVFLGGGPTHGIAWEAMLKLTEMAERPAVAYHPLEFRHGPIALAGPGAVAVLFGTRAGARLEADLVRDLRNHGTMVVILRDDWKALAEAEVDVALGMGLTDAARSLLYLPFAQALAYHRAVGGGLNPDRPRHLTSVVRLPLR